MDLAEIFISLHSENHGHVFANDFWFRSSVGLEQRPSKPWVKGSNPFGITEEALRMSAVLLSYISYIVQYGRTERPSHYSNKPYALQVSRTEQPSHYSNKPYVLQVSRTERLSLYSARAASTCFSTSFMSTVGSKRAITSPLRLMRNLVKFNCMSSFFLGSGLASL